MISFQEIMIKLLLGMVLGGFIGFERQTHSRPAGFRTQLLVCVACVLIMIVSEGYYASGPAHPGYVVDPTRIAAGAMTGVGFLGAGVILKTGLSIQGLTTAACIWIVSAIGLAIGAGQYTAGIVGFVITLFSLWVLRIYEGRIPRTVYKYVTMVTDQSGDENAIRSIFGDRGYRLLKMDYRIEFPLNERTYVFTASSKDDSDMKDLIEDISVLPFVKRLEIKS
ncbi:MAG: MgtC/SapB family protein [Candidatus Sulfobium sp.]|jgi:putative Mg2+ transporter-C (MgtC) family protein